MRSAATLCYRSDLHFVGRGYPEKGKTRLYYLSGRFRKNQHGVAFFFGSVDYAVFEIELVISLTYRHNRAGDVTGLVFSHGVRKRVGGVVAECDEASDSIYCSGVGGRIFLSE